MRINTRWITKPSHIVLTLIILATLTQIQPCSATEQQNKTLTELSNYTFTAGYQNIVKYSQYSDGNYWIMKKTPIPSLNISYKAPSDGQLTIILTPVEGPLPYIELEGQWETIGKSYTLEMKTNQTCSFFLSPPLILSDSNFSQIVNGATTTWEVYRWPNITGQITHIFFTSENIQFDLVIHPKEPRQDEEINLVTYSNAEINNHTWVLLGDSLYWKNYTDVLEINGLKSGNYTVWATGIDLFNNSHTIHTIFTVLPPKLNTQSFDLGFFSVSYPDAVSQGETITLSSTIDYSMPFPVMIKCELFDPVNNVECKSLTYNVSDSGSKSFNHQLTEDKEGVKPLILRLYYDIGTGWIEVSEAETNLSVTINKAQTSTSIPGYHPIILLMGITLVTILSRYQKNN